MSYTGVRAFFHRWVPIGSTWQKVAMTGNSWQWVAKGGKCEINVRVIVVFSGITCYAWYLFCSKGWLSNWEEYIYTHGRSNWS